MGRHNKGSRIVLGCFGNYLVPFWVFFVGFVFSARSHCYLQHFGVGSYILELEAAVSTVFAAFLTLNLSFRWNLQHVLARTVHVTW